MIIKEQFERKEQLKWRLGLRNDEKIEISSIGLKFLNLSKNSFGDYAATRIAQQLETCDLYLKCLNLRYNKIEHEGVTALLEAVPAHYDLVSIDLRDNPGYHPKEKIHEMAQYAFLKNIQR